MMIFTLEEFDEYEHIAYVTNDDMGADVRISMWISDKCYNYDTGEWNDNKICDEIDGTLADIFGKNRAKVERPYEVVTPDEFPRAINFTL